MVEISIDQEVETLSRGDLVFIPPQAVHRMKNIGHENVEYIALGISKTGRGKTVTV
jgi:quercetin dioxygenase-like cupin family protein